LGLGSDVLNFAEIEARQIANMHAEIADDETGFLQEIWLATVDIIVGTKTDATP
jgi:hypothetical protein